MAPHNGKGEMFIDIVWIIIFIVIALMKNANKQRGSVGRNKQPWDDIRRKQKLPDPREVEQEKHVNTSGKSIKDEIKEFLKEIQPEYQDDVSPALPPIIEVQKEVEHEGVISTEGISGGKEGHRGKNEGYGFPKEDEVQEEPEKLSELDTQISTKHYELVSDRAAIVNGIIMSEILQPPRAKRPRVR